MRPILRTSLKAPPGACEGRQRFDHVLLPIRDGVGKVLSEFATNTRLAEVGIIAIFLAP